MSSVERLRDLLLGYNDSPTAATQEEVNVYFSLWNQGWRPDMFVDLAKSTVTLREPRNDEEMRVTKIATAAIERAAKTSRRSAGGRPRTA
jgi:hypothetical protein